MAETIVYLLTVRLVSFLTNEGAEWLTVGTDLRRKLTEVKDELETIGCFLRDADERADKGGFVNDGVETWVKQVRQIAYRIEDVIDEYMLRVAQHGGVHRHGFTDFLKKTTYFLKNFRLGHGLGAEIQHIKASLREIKERSDRYGFSSSNSGSSSVAHQNCISWHDPRVASHFISAAEAVGRDDAQSELIGWLKSDPTKRKVIAVVGMGGLGKTTLAKVVYDSSTVKEHFLCFAWITVSQSYVKEELLQKLIKQFCPAEESTSEAWTIGTSELIQLVSKLRRYLQGKRYVVVFDDIWNVNFWAEVEHALPDDNIGSRIMITTRNQDVANFCKKSSFVHVHDLQLLPPNLAWELFCKKAFQFDFDGHCPKMLERLSADIVRKCGGLPLAIVAIGGLLSTKDKSIPEWQKLHDRLHSELESNPHLTNITKILSLSYYDLPIYLRYCFLYLGIFPEDYFISAQKLIWAWVAEGFVQAKCGRTLEQVAEEYVAELIQRNMIKCYWGSRGLSKYCMVHDLMRETIFSVVGKLNFCQVLDAENSILSRETRRLSMHNVSGNILDREESIPVRTLFIFSKNEMSKSFVERLIESFKLLKVLDLEESPKLDHLPDNVGNLLHLRYLSVRNTNIKKLPKSVGKLLNLRTLNLYGTRVQELPMEIYRLHKLCHLLCGWLNLETDYALSSYCGARIHDGVGALTDLQTLSGVEVAEDLVEELMKLRQLRVLVITNVTAEIGRTLCAAIENMNHLVTLDVSSKSEGEVLDLESISFAPPFLQTLSLKGHLKKLPNWINSQLLNVASLRLYFSRLMDDPLKALQALPNLLNLKLVNAYCGEKLHIEEGWFPKVQVLWLESLERLTTLTIENGAMPRLQELWISLNPHMKELPRDIIFLRNLETLIIREMPRELVLRILPDQGQDYWILEHIPVVQIFFKTRGHKFQMFKLGDTSLLRHLEI